MTILIKNQQRLSPLNKNRIEKTARKILIILKQPMAELSILFVGDRKMTKLNAEYRGINRTTDVLSFPQAFHFPLLASRFVLGDIVISVPRAKYQAKSYGTGFYDELLRLLIHGTLHLLGYDHEKSDHHNRKMRKKEQEIFNAFKKMD